uniref:Neuritin 1 n=1 Tax=Neogobius melanostomus TaxID=47308 RepID=A0A8C6SDC7_9GOBI
LLTPKMLLCLAACGQAVDPRCENVYKDFSDCVLQLGQSMDNYQENVTSERGLVIYCTRFVLSLQSHWENFHTCALTALSDCQEEVSSIWETLRQDSKKMRFQGSLFDLCSQSASPRISAPLWAAALPLLVLLLELSALDWGGV